MLQHFFSVVFFTKTDNIRVVKGQRTRKLLVSAINKIYNKLSKIILEQNITQIVINCIMLSRK